MLLITVPLMIILAVTAFLFNNFYNNTSNKQTYSAAGNFLLYHNAMYAYAAANLNNLTPNIPIRLSQVNVNQGIVVFTAPVYPSYFDNIDYVPMGNYNSWLIQDSNGVNYVISSLGNVGGNSPYALKAINSIATNLQTPNSGISQNYQVKIAMIDKGDCTNPIILNSDLNGNGVVSSTYGSIYTSLCNQLGQSAIRKYVLMEALQ